MTLEREMHADLRALLMANEPFEYAHLIKFERPSRPDAVTGQASTGSVRYTYLTDASRDIPYDDGSRDSTGILNGVQNYIANKVLKVSEVSETVEAKASNFTVTLDGNGLGAEIGTQSMTITSVSTGVYDIEIIDKTVDPVYEGFREGDKIELYGARTGFYNISNFRENNVIRVTKIDDTLTAGSVSMGIRLTSEEIKSILIDKNVAEYSSFINREVFIYKIFQKDGAVVGAPILLFKGIISNVSFEDGDKGIVVSWGLTSHWGDFAQVKGRLTSDDFHRALDQNGVPQPGSALKPEYAYDMGFLHAETSLNTLATYTVKVEKQKIKTKKGFLGIGAKVKVKKYYVDEARNTELDFQLAARAIPLHYGVRLTEGIPIFADTLKNDSSTVYVIYALGEGPIASIYDVYVDGKSLICNDKSDLDARSLQTADNTIPVLCRGRADRGDVLGGSLSTNPNDTPISFYDTTEPPEGTITWYFWKLLHQNYQPYIPPVDTASYNSTGVGVVDGETIYLTSPIDMSIDFFAGTPGQKASSQLITIAAANNFKTQADYWHASPNAPDYWGPNHRLLDTAYVVCKFKITEGETEIPPLEFILHSKVIECYNYDYSYTHDPKQSSESPDNFALGTFVNVKRADTNAIINNNLQIVDKWTFARGDGSQETRFRLSAPPALGYVDGIPTIKKFYIEQGANKWTMTTFDYIENSGTITEELTADVTPVNDGGNYTIPVPTGDTGTGGDPNQPSPIYSEPGNSTLITGDISGGFLKTPYSFWDVHLQ